MGDTDAAVDEHAHHEAGEAFHLGVWTDVSRQIEIGPHATPHDLIVVRRLDRLLEDAELCRRPLRLGLVGLRLLVQDVQAGLPQARDVTWRLGELRPVRADREMLRRVLHQLMEHAVRGSGGNRLVEVWSGVDHAHRVVSVRSRGEDRDSAVAAQVDGVWGHVTFLAGARDFRRDQPDCGTTRRQLDTTIASGRQHRSPVGGALPVNAQLKRCAARRPSLRGDPECRHAPHSFVQAKLNRSESTFTLQPDFSEETLGDRVMHRKHLAIVPCETKNPFHRAVHTFDVLESPEQWVVTLELQAAPVGL